ncbi:MAG: hypothetical protein H0W06_08045 [Chloroflexia bacterium]|nr:hypothetical protein [Chloroflexia bacterium]
MKRALFAAEVALSFTLGTVGVIGAEPSNFPTNPEACVGTSSTTANVAFQEVDPDKLRSDQARADDGQPGRADSVAVIPQCVASENDRGVID